MAAMHVLVTCNKETEKISSLVLTAYLRPDHQRHTFWYCLIGFLLALMSQQSTQTYDQCSNSSQSDIVQFGVWKNCSIQVTSYAGCIVPVKAIFYPENCHFKFNCLSDIILNINIVDISVEASVTIDSECRNMCTVVGDVSTHDLQTGRIDVRFLAHLTDPDHECWPKQQLLHCKDYIILKDRLPSPENVSISYDGQMAIISWSAPAEYDIFQSTHNTGIKGYQIYISNETTSIPYLNETVDGDTTNKTMVNVTTPSCVGIYAVYCNGKHSEPFLSPILPDKDNTQAPLMSKDIIYNVAIINETYISVLQKAKVANITCTIGFPIKAVLTSSCTASYYRDSNQKRLLATTEKLMTTKNVTVTDEGEVLLVFSLPRNQRCNVTINLSTDDISGQTAKYEYSIETSFSENFEAQLAYNTITELGTEVNSSCLLGCCCSDVDSTKNSCLDNCYSTSQIISVFKDNATTDSCNGTLLVCHNFKGRYVEKTQLRPSTCKRTSMTTVTETSKMHVACSSMDIPIKSESPGFNSTASLIAAISEGLIILAVSITIIVVCLLWIKKKNPCTFPRSTYQVSPNGNQMTDLAHEPSSNDDETTFMRPREPSALTRQDKNTSDQSIEPPPQLRRQDENTSDQSTEPPPHALRRQDENTSDQSTEPPPHALRRQDENTSDQSTEPPPHVLRRQDENTSDQLIEPPPQLRRQDKNTSDQSTEPSSMPRLLPRPPNDRSASLVLIPLQQPTAESSPRNLQENTSPFQSHMPQQILPKITMSSEKLSVTSDNHTSDKLKQQLSEEEFSDLIKFSESSYSQHLAEESDKLADDTAYGWHAANPIEETKTTAHYKLYIFILKSTQNSCWLVNFILGISNNDELNKYVQRQFKDAETYSFSFEFSVDPDSTTKGLIQFIFTDDEKQQIHQWFKVQPITKPCSITRKEIDNWYRIFGPGNNFDYNMMPGPVCRVCEVVANGPFDTIVPEQVIIPIKGISPEKTLMLEIKGTELKASLISDSASCSDQ